MREESAAWSALNRQLFAATVDWHRKGCPANRRRALRKLEKIEQAAWEADRKAAPSGYEGPITRGSDPR